MCDGGLDLAQLQARMQQVRDGVSDVKVIVMDSIVPGQRLSLTAPPQLVALFSAKNRDRAAVVVLGRQGSNIARHGVEVTLEQMTLRPVIPGIHPEGTADITLAAGRLCEITTLDTDTPKWLGRRGRARWVTLDGASGDAPPLEEGLLSRSEALEAATEEWIGLVRTTKLVRGQRRLEGWAEAYMRSSPIPKAELPEQRALWVAGLINPPAGVRGRGTPARDVAAEVRPSVMMGPTPELRLRAVERALQASIRKLRGLAGDPPGGGEFSP